MGVCISKQLKHEYDAMMQGRAAGAAAPAGWASARKSAGSCTATAPSAHAPTTAAAAADVLLGQPGAAEADNTAPSHDTHTISSPVAAHTTIQVRSSARDSQVHGWAAVSCAQT
jgi:hypothetical protein